MSNIDKNAPKTYNIKAKSDFRSWKAINESNLVMQSRDFSCGSAALATLIRYYFNQNITEDEVLKIILESLTQGEVIDREKKGLTMLDLKLCAELLGYQAVGVKLPISTLKKLNGPIIVHLKKDNYKHYAVLRAIRDDRVYISDPSRGNITFRIWRFATEWTGFALILGKEGFGMPNNHRLSVRNIVPTQEYGIAISRARGFLQ